MIAFAMHLSPKGVAVVAKGTASCNDFTIYRENSLVGTRRFYFQLKTKIIYERQHKKN